MASIYNMRTMLYLINSIIDYLLLVSGILTTTIYFGSDCLDLFSAEFTYTMKPCHQRDIGRGLNG